MGCHWFVHHSTPQSFVSGLPATSRTSLSWSNQRGAERRPVASPHWRGGGMSRQSQPTRGSRADPDTRTLWAVVPAGGFGTRLWPLSRAARPKFLLPLLGERSLLQLTLDRLAASVPPERTLVVCGPAHAAPVARQLPALPERNVLVEPSPRG